MVNIQSPTAEIRRGKKRRKKKEETGWKYNGLPYYIGRPQKERICVWIHAWVQSHWSSVVYWRIVNILWIGVSCYWLGLLLVISTSYWDFSVWTMHAFRYSRCESHKSVAASDSLTKICCSASKMFIIKDVRTFRNAGCATGVRLARTTCKITDTCKQLLLLLVVVVLVPWWWRWSNVDAAGDCACHLHGDEVTLWVQLRCWPRIQCLCQQPGGATLVASAIDA